MNEPQVYRVPKTCPDCGHFWQGNSFAPAPPNGSSITHRCDDCITKWERAQAAVPPAPREVIELARPDRGGLNEDY